MDPKGVWVSKEHLWAWPGAEISPVRISGAVSRLTGSSVMFFVRHLMGTVSLPRHKASTTSGDRAVFRAVPSTFYCKSTEQNLPPFKIHISQASSLLLCSGHCSRAPPDPFHPCSIHTPISCSCYLPTNLQKQDVHY